MIWSLTPFFNETEVFEIRLAELDPIVDVHVVAESTLTYSGDEKPLYFQQALDEGRYDQWKDKIRYVVVDDSPVGKDDTRPTHAFQPHVGKRWQRENHQRDALLRGCVGMQDDDGVLLSDADEIPRANTVESVDNLLSSHDITPIHLPQHVMYLDWRWSEPTTIAICRMTTGYRMKQMGPQGVRDDERSPALRDPNAGWHFSYMGGAEAIQYKIQSAAHAELDQPQYTDLTIIAKRMRYGQDMFDRPERKVHQVPFEELPQYVQDNEDRFLHLLSYGEV